MADATQFATLCIQKAQQISNLMEDLRVMSSRMTEDTGLAAAAATAAQNNLRRQDLATADFTNFKSALDQLLFTFDSGSPTQKSYIFKLL